MREIFIYWTDADSEHFGKMMGKLYFLNKSIVSHIIKNEKSQNVIQRVNYLINFI